MKSEFCQIIVSALVLIVSSQMGYAGLSAPLPEFKSAEVLQKSSHENYVKADSDAQTFYTGKPFELDRGAYLFKWRSYDAEINRWSATDPSGFPDGANNSAYLPVPTSQFDWQGLLVSAIYSITQQKLTIDGTEYTDCNSGDNEYGNRFSEGGPLPTGTYRIFSRDGNNPSYEGHMAFILDPVDGLFNARNDRWDSGDGEGRWGFRIHTNVSTTGCIATASIDSIASQIWATEHNLQQNIVQSSSIPGAETFENEWFFGTLEVVE